jgi:hypothetical protein
MAPNPSRIFVLFLLPLAFLCAGSARAKGPAPAAEAAWQRYVRLTEARIERELQRETSARPGAQAVVERLETKDGTKPIEAPDALIHHWKGSVFIPGVNLARVLSFVQDYDQHSRFFQEVEKSRLVSRHGDNFSIFYRLKRTKLITVHYNTEHAVTYRTLSPKEAASRSATTRIAELEKPGTAAEREKKPDEDNGFLWRLNSYWRFTERDGGVIAECESVSLSRDIPTGLGWLVRGYVESIPRESLVNTLASLSNGVRGN